MKFSIVHKFSLAAILLVFISAGLVGWVFYNKTAELLVTEALEDISNDIRHAGDRLNSHITSQSEDTLFLTSVPPIQGMLRALKTGNYDKQGNSSYTEWAHRLELIFKTILQSKTTYLKLRFIDTKGQELVVVGREDNKINALRDKQLQNKSHRNYVKDTVKLSKGAVYLSEISLNREYGKVSLPHQEVIRSASPIYNEQNGKVAGLLLITAEIGHELRDIQRDVHSTTSNIYITNDHGGYLLHPDRDKGYGFDLGKRYRIQEDFPRLATLFLPDNKESEVILRPKDIGGKNVINFTKIYFDTRKPERYIAVGMTESYNAIVARQTGVLNDVLILVALLVIVSILLAIIFSYRLSKPVSNITQMMDDYIHQRTSSITVPLNRNDEIGLLARSYHLLLDEVDESRANLEEANRTLESRVIERTKALEVSEMRQRSIVDNIVDGLITIDEKGLITSLNPAAINIFGYQADEVVGLNVKMLMPEPYHSEHDQYLENYHQTGNKKIIGIGREVEGRRKDGSTFPLELAVSEVEVDNQIMFTGIVRDITERKQMDKIKNEFISTVSHELRTPLTSIRGSLGLIMGGAVGKLPEEANHMLQIASNNTERLLLLINDILDMQKIESGQLTMKLTKVAVMPFIEQALEDNAGYGDQHNVKFVIDRALDDAQVYADRDRLMQVMANLLSNAAKFSPNNDTVEISVARHHGSIRVSVTDHGEGIPEEFQPKLFEKFTQSDSSDTRQKGGTGLGLSITKVILESLGGRIDFVSKKGVGTTFYFELPELVGDIKTDNIKLRKLSNEKHIPCILIIEDDEDVAALLRRMLAESGYNADIAYNVSEAREYLKENNYNYKMITLDLMLPGEDGLSFLEELRANEKTAELPVLVVSAKADEAKRNLVGGTMGVVDWLSKPIDEERLLNAVKQLASKCEFPRVLHVEDESDVHNVVKMMLRDHCDLRWAATFAEAKKTLEAEDFDLILLDIGLPDGSGLDLIPIIEQHPSMPQIVIFSAYDVASEYAERVSEVLIKSKTDNFTLAEVINKLLG